MANEQQMQAEALKEHNHRWPSPNHNFVPEYQQSGIPFAKREVLTAITLTKQIVFPSVTRWITITSPSEVYINFHEDDTQFSDEKSFFVPANTATRFELKCKKLNIRADSANVVAANPPVAAVDQYVYILAGLTNVPTRNFPDQTAANGFSV